VGQDTRNFLKALEAELQMQADRRRELRLAREESEKAQS